MVNIIDKLTTIGELRAEISKQENIILQSNNRIRTQQERLGSSTNSAERKFLNNFIQGQRRKL